MQDADAVSVLFEELEEFIGHRARGGSSKVEAHSIANEIAQEDVVGSVRCGSPFGVGISPSLQGIGPFADIS